MPDTPAAPTTPDFEVEELRAMMDAIRVRDNFRRMMHDEGGPMPAPVDEAMGILAVLRERGILAARSTPAETLDAIIEWWRLYNRSEASIYRHEPETIDSLETILTRLSRNEAEEAEG